MSVKIIYFVHGTTIDNENEIATGWNPGELSKLGKKQAKELGREWIPAFAGMTEPFSVLYCSDLKRAVDSANLGFGKSSVLAKAGIKIIPDKRLREINYGDLNGQPEGFKEDLTEFIDQPFPNGESLKDVEKRISDFLKYLRKDFDGKNIAILAHQAPQLALDVLLKGKTWEQAFHDDWRKTKSWQPGWEYELK